MSLWEAFLAAGESLRSNKMRSVLTMLGIVIGVASVIAVMAIGQGGRAAIMSEYEKYGSNLLAFFPNSAETSIAIPSRELLTVQDADALKKEPSIAEVAPGINGRGEVRSGNVRLNLNVTASTESFKRIYHMDLVVGRFFTDREERSRLKVIVVEENVVQELGLTGSGVGQKVFVNDVPVTIVGVQKSENTTINAGAAIYNAFIPLGTWNTISASSSGVPGAIDWIQVKLADGTVEEDVTSMALSTLNSRHHTQDKYAVQSLEQIKSQVDSSTRVLGLIVGFIAAISLLVGGIGVMNIMLMSVTERTREIGIRKALGAGHSDLIRQFLLESSLLCLMGGALGVLLGMGGAFLIARYAGWPPFVSLSTVGLAVGFSLVVGMFFGLYPASRAARLDPIDALRHE